MMLKYLLLIGFIFSISVAQADDSDIDCDNMNTQYALNYCSAKDSVESDKALEVIYQEALNYLSDEPSKQNLFKQTQEIWVKYSELNCDVQAGERADSGSIWPYLVASCNARMNNSRIEEIKETVLGNT